MKLERRRIGNKEVFPFTIPSGIVTTEASAIERIANEVPEIGILTTKSIGPEPKPGNREPILAQYAPYCWTNAVGLTNPGAGEFAKRLGKIKIPKDKILLVSIFGKDAEEFAKVARTLEANADGFELNLSCPHAKGYGMQLGQDPEMVRNIVEAVRTATKKPIFAKLTPNVSNIAEIAQSAMNAGAYGITAINTVGPGAYLIDNHYVLTNRVGGISGRGITPIGIKCVKDITDKLGNIPIIGCGGIYIANDVISYSKAGASFFGIGSALAGMTEFEIKHYFSALVKDIEKGTNAAKGLLPSISTSYRKFTIDEKTDLSNDLHILEMNGKLEADAGQFVFAWIPEKGEKPFSIMDTDPLKIGFLERGCFTKELAKLKKGDEIYFKGPYGLGFTSMDSDIVLVGGGCGIFGLNLFAKRFNERGTYHWEHNEEIVTVLGAKDKEHIPPLDLFEQCGEVHVATEDGSHGKKGFVTDLFSGLNLNRNCYFLNCGPKAMIEAVLPLELQITSADKVYSSIDYMTRCGVGICGSCANEQGLRTCVEGPFISSQR